MTEHVSPGAHVDCPVCGAKKWERCVNRRPHAERVEKERDANIRAIVEPLIRAAMGFPDKP